MTDNDAKTPTEPLIALSGTSGELGSRVARVLSDEGVKTLLVGRTLAKLPDLPGSTKRGPAAFDEADAMRAALAGATGFLLVSANLSGRRLEEHSIAIDAALAAGVKQIVYISLVGAGRNAVYVNARDHADTEEYLAGKDVRWTVLRAGYYASWLPRLVENNLIKGPAADGTVAAVSHDDIARVAAGILTDTTGRWDGQILDVTGPEAVTLSQVAEILTDVTGESHSYQAETMEEAIAWRATIDVPQWRREVWLTWYDSVAHGAASNVTDVVEQVTGRKPMTIREALLAQNYADLAK